MGCILSCILSCIPNSEIPPELASYESELRKDPSLRSFDTFLHECTTHAIESVANSPSLDSLLHVTGSFADINGQVVQLILQSKEDIQNNPDLLDLVQEYFSSSTQVLNFYAALDNCIKKVKNSHTFLQLAITRFDQEKTEPGNQLSNTLRELDNFISTGDPFTKEFFTLFLPVYNQQALMLSKLKAKRDKLVRKQNELELYRKISNVLFAAAFAAVVISSAVVAAVAARPLVAKLLAASSEAIGTMGEWMSSLWKGYEDGVKRKLELVLKMENETLIAKAQLEDMQMLAKKLKDDIETMLFNAGLAIEREDEVAVSLAIDEIKKKLEAFTQTVDFLGQQSEMYRKDIMRARDQILQKIKNY